MAFVYGTGDLMISEGPTLIVRAGPGGAPAADYGHHRGLASGQHLFPDDSRSPHICLHANARLWLPAFYSASKTLKQKPHTHVFPSHMVVIVYVVRQHGCLGVVTTVTTHSRPIGSRTACIT
jgi:hypothetical protein